MPVSRIQSRFRASLFYVGAAVFFGSGVVVLADHPLGDGPPAPCNCNQGVGNACAAGGGGCTGHPTAPCALCSCHETEGEDGDELYFCQAGGPH